MKKDIRRNEVKLCALVKYEPGVMTTHEKRSKILFQGRCWVWDKEKEDD